jgi:tRNA A-37 threonylcarbamoyl transferase component Bud32/tetratricopeptide (TPR) repeat protein
MSADRELLYAVMAVQLGFVDAGTVMAAGAEWAARRAEGQRLGDVLLAQKRLRPEQARFIDEVVERAIELHGGEAPALDNLPDTDVVQCLSGSMTGRGSAHTVSSGERWVPPLESLEGLENVCIEMPGRYEFTTGPEGSIEELGRGGIGRVVAAMDHYVGREVAMKQLLTDHTSNASFDTQTTVGLEARFLREARVTAQLDHPSVVPVFEIGRRRDGSLFYTMRRVRGGTLSNALARARTVQERLRLLPHVLHATQAVASAHYRGVIHRDLKPQNIMVGRFGETYLLDWGLARVKGRSDPRAEELRLAPDITGGVRVGAVGTPSYMSPEQAAGDVGDIDERSDVWGLGAVLYEVLTQKPPYSGTNPFEVIGRILQEDVPAVRLLQPDVPRELADICQKALARAPKDRYQTAQALAEDLEAWLTGRRVSAHDYGSLELARQFLRRNRAPVAVAAVAGLALLVGGVLALNRVREERNTAQHFAELTLGEVVDTVSQVPGSRPLVERLTLAATQFYGGQASLSEPERLSLARAWLHLGDLERRQAKLDDARKCYQQCLELQALPRREVRTQATAEATALSCAEGLAVADNIEGKNTEARARLEALWSDWGDQAERFETAEWKAAVAGLGTALSKVRLVAGEDVRALAEQTRQLGEAAVRLAPSTDGYRKALALTLRDYELQTWDFKDPQVALKAGDDGLVVARPLVKSSDVPSLVTLGALERQHGMLLRWSARAAEAGPLLEEALSVLRRAAQLEPNDLGALGELGDTLLELGRGTEAREVLQRCEALGLRDEYLDSLAFAEFLSGRYELAAARSRVDAGTASAQVRFFAALSEVQLGHAASAAAMLERLSGDGALSSVQWPRGVVLARFEADPTAWTPVLRRFCDAMDRVYPLNDDASLSPVLADLAQELGRGTPRP